MIFDFIVDFDYLAKTIADGDKTGCLYINRLFEIITRENGRLMIPIAKDGKVFEMYYESGLKQVCRVLGKTPGRLAQVCNEYCTLLRAAFNPTEFGINKRIASGTENMPGIALRKIQMPELEDENSNFIKEFCEACHKSEEIRVRVILTDKTDFHGEKVLLEKYFNGNYKKEKMRFAWMMKQTITRNNNMFGSVEDKPFVEQLKAFGAAEEVGFWIFDPYVLGGNCRSTAELDKKIKLLFDWIEAIFPAGGDPDAFQVEVYTNKLTVEDARLKKSKELNSKELNKEVEDYRKRRNGTKLPRVVIKVLEGGDNRFHDRFVCSSTHYFALGRGLDALLSSKVYNVYYCGRMPGKGEFPSDLDDIKSQNTWN